ncbi:ATP-binding protein [Spirulina major CS-329]|uniref:hybrid sensor histidine kinase/response regulator n=1 Tax=Spirulina TaxID=1154 RepID=UPI00232E1F8C|nr:MULTISPECIES: ATP-binding protein [Spirulina]MDB9493921.1 ATP-binding protein [Spirulina subsalsa CS-330]MDB9503841.1 ATP-binding protein [Spirulina major CS-329]
MGEYVKTALSDTLDKVKGLQLGAVDYITKPIQQDEVLARIKVHLQLYTLQRSLEEQVAARTATLNAALEDLKQTQVKLIQGEKMSALGQLVAGIAHEINNPINFIHGNLQPARDYITDLLELVALICQHCPTLPPPVLEQMETIDLDFIRDDLPRLLQSMDLGTQRIRDLVLSLRNFSRLDESETKAVDLHEGLESTLLILHNRCKATASGPGITIQKQYGTLPLVECYPSQVNQVFMNLLSNAIDALNSGEFPPEQPPQIQIITQAMGRDRVQIMITDNGPGIPTAIQAKIFDAFFTTKPISQGTGLGLSISQQIIVEKHGGQLRCDSPPPPGNTLHD